MIVAKPIFCFERMRGWDMKVVLEYGFLMITYHVITVDIMWSKLLLFEYIDWIIDGYWFGIPVQPVVIFIRILNGMNQGTS